jgi:hypothetical protein
MVVLHVGHCTSCVAIRWDAPLRFARNIGRLFRFIGDVIGDELLLEEIIIYCR